MKKVLYAILICFILTPCFAFVGCNKDKKYSAKDFYTSYQNIAQDNTNLALVPANNIYQTEINATKIDINYELSTKLTTLANDSSTQYYQLKHFYQQLLDDSLSPLYFFGEKISSSKNISNSQAKQLSNRLDALQAEYEDLNYYVGILINSLHATNDSNINLSNLKKVFLQYEDAINEANKLSSVVCNVYFGSVLSNANVNYSNKTYDQLTDTDLSRIAIDTRVRIYYYKSVYANVYNQLYVRGNNLAEQLSSSTSITLPSYAPYSYVKGLTSLDSHSPTTLENNKQSIYNNIVSLYNIQKSFNKAYNVFNTATSKVVYSNLSEYSSATELNYGTLINQFANGIAIDSFEILNNLVNLLYT